MTASSAMRSIPEGREFSAELVVQHRHEAADGVVVLDLVDPHGAELPEWEPGAHVDAFLDEAVVRQYSLCGDPRDSHTWRIGVLLDPNGRGGSRYVHHHLHEGASIRIGGPRNHFPLVDSPRYRFIAGGIGITPMKAMVQAAERAGREWSLIYLGRTRSTMAFEHELVHRYGDRVTIWCADERGKKFDLDAELSEPALDTLVYTCGPESLLSHVEKSCGHWPAGSLHLERFAAKAPSPNALTQALGRYHVVCQRSGMTIEVSSDQPMLDALEDAGIPIMSSCGEGICGTCRTTVLDGIPDHRDSLLTENERASGQIVLPCVSHSRSEKLVLDL